MKATFSLSVVCFTLALCHGFCIHERNKLEFKDGKFVVPVGCVDAYDGTKHPTGSVWNTAKCMRCKCSKDGISCCSRYGGIAEVEGCKGVLDPETCTFKFYKSNDSSVPCV